MRLEVRLARESFPSVRFSLSWHLTARPVDTLRQSTVSYHLARRYHPEADSLVPSQRAWAMLCVRAFQVVVRQHCWEAVELRLVTRVIVTVD
jgi:hypothetical protein